MGNMLVIIAVCIDLEIVTNIIRKISFKYCKGKDCGI